MSSIKLSAILRSWSNSSSSCLICWSLLTGKGDSRKIQLIIMTYLRSQYNVHSDWLILGHYSPVMPTGRLKPCKNQAKSHFINCLLTMNVRTLWENWISNLNLIDMTSLSLGQYGMVTVWHFPIKTSLSVKK